MSSVAIRSTRPMMIEGEAVSHAAAAVVAGKAEAHMAELFHHLDHHIRH